MEIFHYADIQITLRRNSRYPLRKFALLKEGVISSGLVQPQDLHRGSAVGSEVLSLGHNRDYIEAVRTGTLSEHALREMGFCWSPALYERGRRIVGSTLDAAQSALRDGVSCVLGGGAHHSHYNGGRGFCVFNDAAICANYLLQQEISRGVGVFDCDVHQGDGTASILASQNGAHTCSIHAERNYPFRKVESDFDYGLPDDVSDAEYLETVVFSLQQFLESYPIDFCIYIGGADPYREDRLGRLNISASALATRDRYVLETLRERDISVVILFGGGYCDPIESTVAINLETIRQAKQVFEEGKTNMKHHIGRTG